MKIVSFDRKSLSWVVEFIELVKKAADDMESGVRLAQEIVDKDIWTRKNIAQENPAVPRARVPAYRLKYDFYENSRSMYYPGALVL